MTKEEFAVQFLRNLLNSNLAAKNLCRFCPNKAKCDEELLTPEPLMCDMLGFLDNNDDEEEVQI